MTYPFWWSHIVFALSVCLYTKLLLHQSQKYVLHGYFSKLCILAYEERITYVVAEFLTKNISSKMCMCNAFYILNRNSSKLCMLAANCL